MDFDRFIERSKHQACGNAVRWWGKGARTGDLKDWRSGMRPAGSQGSFTGIREGTEQGKDLFFCVFGRKGEAREICASGFLARIILQGLSWASNAGLPYCKGDETIILYEYPAGAIPLEYIMESLILAQNERWRRVLSMQVERQGGAIPPRAADW